jgi:hypothetical protein
MKLSSRRLVVLVSAAAAACEFYDEQRKRRITKRRYWVRPFLRNRKTYGDFYCAVSFGITLVLISINTINMDWAKCGLHDKQLFGSAYLSSMLFRMLT